MKPWPWWKTLLVFSFASAGSVFVTLSLIVGFAGGWRSSPERKQAVAFSELLDAVESGRVEEIDVAGREYTFVVADGSHRVTRWALGPRATLDELRTLRPKDPDRTPPRVTVEPER